MNRPFRIAIGIPTVGRAAILCETLREIHRQTRPPDRVVVCGTQVADLDGVEVAYPGVLCLLPTETGLTRQRNAICDACGDFDILVFFDDDFLPGPNFLRVIEETMANAPQIVVATGLVLQDGIIGPGLTVADAHGAFAEHSGTLQDVKPVFTGYGCNMAVRLEPMRRHHVRFDNRLPLYGWQEDVDFSRRLGRFGDVVQVAGAFGVHLGVKSGRASGVRLGYSQIANPLYLSAKRAGYPWCRAMTHIARNVTMNIVKSVRPETYVDRRGRLHGNLLALVDLLRGRIMPERILEL